MGDLLKVDLRSNQLEGGESKLIWLARAGDTAISWLITIILLGYSVYVRQGPERYAGFDGDLSALYWQREFEFLAALSSSAMSSGLILLAILSIACLILTAFAVKEVIAVKRDISMLINMSEGRSITWIARSFCLATVILSIILFSLFAWPNELPNSTWMMLALYLPIFFGMNSVLIVGLLAAANVREYFRKSNGLKFTLWLLIALLIVYPWVSVLFMIVKR